MSFSINTNIVSLQAQTNLQTNSQFQATTIGQVTSGLRIVHSGDDAAGLAVANSYRSDEAVLTQGIRNANDGISQLQIIDGGLNNISQLLDRARTLATQSASGTFTGDRSVLNQEFQSVLGEVNRQAQSIGLNSGGQFATNLSVFIGGGKTSGAITASQNGAVGVDLSKSAVDTQSLGLNGVQAIGVAGTDLSTASGTTSLAQVLSNATNTGSTQTPGFATFYVKGPGFDGQGVKISVNTASLGSTAALATAVNAAISAAAANGTAQGTALSNAQVSASINTDANNKQQLAFSSSNSAFQVQAGDRLANALLGNFEQNASASSSSSYQTINASGGTSALTFNFDSSASPVTVTLASGAGSATTTKASIVSQLNANTAFAQSATATLSGNQIVIRSNTNSSSSSIGITNTTLSDALGFTSGSPVTQVAASASTGAAIQTSVQASGAYAVNQNLLGTAQTFPVTISGANNTLNLTVGTSASTAVTVANGTYTAGQLATALNTAIGAAGGNPFTGSNAVSASVVNNQVVLTAGAAGAAISATGASTLAGFATGSAITSGTSPLVTSSNIQLQFQGGSLTSPVDISLASTVGTTTVSSLLTTLQSAVAANTQLSSAGISVSSSASGLTFTNSKGEQIQVQATGDTTNQLGLGSFITGQNNALDYTSLSAGSTYSAATATGTANLEISLNGASSSSNLLSASLTGTTTTPATAGNITSNTITFSSGEIDLSGTAGAGAAVAGTIDGSHAFSVTVGNSATTSVQTLLNDFNSTAGFSNFATASLDQTGTKLVLTSKSTGTTSTVAINAGGSDAGALTALKLSAAATPTTTPGTAAVSTGPTTDQVVQALNAQIAQNSSLLNAGLQATDNGGNTITLKSTNNTSFRVGSYGADIGFGNLGATFTGNSSSNAPAIANAFDSNGANASATLNFKDLSTASDAQTINITASDVNGVKHPLSITLQNSNTGTASTTVRNARTIDDALSTINTALQQSSDPTLQKIVAVKEDVGGQQSIRFLSTDPSFQVSFGGTPNQGGLQTVSGNVSSSATLGSGSTATIGDQNSANIAVNTLALAVKNLGVAQAAIGRGQNEFNYAVNLAQSQLTNETAAESQIRDANLAQESANLTKAQILIQAGVAALAQANSAPQQLLTLLQGH